MANGTSRSSGNRSTWRGVRPLDRLIAWGGRHGADQDGSVRRADARTHRLLSAQRLNERVPASSSATTGTLTGLVRMYGGPMNPQTGKQALNGSPGPNWTVKVLSGARTVAEAKSDAAGKFRFTLAPGRYTLACGQEPGVIVVAGQTASVDCDVPVP